MEPVSQTNATIIKKAKLNKNQTAKNVQFQTPVPKLNADSVEISTKTQKQGLIDKIKSNKKLLIAGGVAIATATATAGIIFGANKEVIPFDVNTKAKNVLNKSDEILAEGSDVLAQGQKEYDEVMNLLTQAKENGFSEVVDESRNLVRNFNLSDIPGCSVMSECFGDKILRRVRFSQTENGFGIRSIEKGVEGLADGGVKIAESFNFSDEHLSSYTKGFKVLPNGKTKINEIYDLSDGVLSCRYIQGSETSADKSIKIAESFNFSDGVLSGYANGWEILADESQKIDETFDFSDGVLSKYMMGFEDPAYGARKAAILNKYENGKLISHQKNIEL